MIEFLSLYSIYIKYYSGGIYSMIAMYFNKNRILKYLISLLVIFFLYFLFYKDLKFFLFFTYSIKAIIGLVSMTIAINTYKISKNTMFTFLAISLGFCGVIDCLSVMFNFHYDLSSIISDHIYLQVFVDFLNIFSLILCAKLHNKSFSFKKVFFLYSLIIISFVFLFMISLFVFRIFPYIYTVIFLNFTIKDMLNFSLFIFSLYPLYIFVNIKDETQDKNLKNIFLLSPLFTFAMLSFFLTLSNDINSILSFTGIILTLFYLYFMCRVILISVLKTPYDALFYDLKRKSDEIEKTKNYYELLIESLPISIIIAKNNKMLFANSSTLDIFDIKSKSTLYAKGIDNLIDDEFLSLFNENIGKKNQSFETKFKTFKDISFDAKIKQLDICFDGSQCTLMIIKDISSKKKINELNHILERKLEEENLRTEFFSNVSHELRTPLNVIYSVLQLEEFYIKKGDMTSIIKHNKTLKQNCLRLLRTCNNLIDVTKIDSGFFSPNMKCLNIVSLIENIVSSVSTYTNSKNMSIVFDTDNEDIYMLCDDDLIERIILNLISNSIKYGSKNGHIWVNIYDESNNVKIIFADDGSGIPKGKCDDMFERFIQIDRSLNRSCEGSGLGLSLVKSLIELHKGTIELESDTDLGCKFTIIIPITTCKSCNTSLTPDSFEENSIIDKINIEFSDIYM